MKTFFRFFPLLLAGILLAGCGGDGNDSDGSNNVPFTGIETGRVVARYDVTTFPLPNDLIWILSDPDPSDDATPVYLPPADNNSPEMLQLLELVNAQQLTGLSPNMFLTLPMTGNVDSSTLDFFIFRIDDPALLGNLFTVAQSSPAGVPAALAAVDYRTAADFVVTTDTDAHVIKLLPKRPFLPGAGYAVATAKGLLDSNGQEVATANLTEALKSSSSLSADSPFAMFEPLRAAYSDGDQSLYSLVAGVTTITSGGTAPWLPENVLHLWTFHTADRTLSLTPTAAAEADRSLAYPTVDADPFSAATAQFYGLSALFTGNNLQWTSPVNGQAVDAPLGVPAALALAGTGLPTGQLGNIYTGTFQSPTLASGGAITTDVTFRMTTPAGTGPWPIVIFQHGITSSKDAALPIANTLAMAGYATLAIDAPLHGERTPEGAASGEGFFTINILENRANIYQAALDLWETVDLVSAGLDLDGDSAIDVGGDGEKIAFIGHSLGSIIGSTFLSQETRVEQMVLSSPTALLMNVLDETALPDLQALTSGLGYTPGTTAYYLFLSLAQWLMDPVDGTYSGIGSNSPEQLLVVAAQADPVVATTSSQLFLSNLGLAAEMTAVDPTEALNPATFAAGGYLYGLPGQPIVHSFLLLPLFDSEADPYYSGYQPQLQELATELSQTQVYGFLNAE